MHVIIDNWDILHAKSVSILTQIAVNGKHIFSSAEKQTRLLQKTGKVQ